MTYHFVTLQLPYSSPFSFDVHLIYLVPCSFMIDSLVCLLFTCGEWRLPKCWHLLGIQERLDEEQKWNIEANVGLLHLLLNS